MNNINEELLQQGMSYTVGINDGKVFDRLKTMVNTHNPKISE